MNRVQIWVSPRVVLQISDSNEIAAKAEANPDSVKGIWDGVDELTLVRDIVLIRFDQVGGVGRLYVLTVAKDKTGCSHELDLTKAKLPAPIEGEWWVESHYAKITNTMKVISTLDDAWRVAKAFAMAFI